MINGPASANYDIDLGAYPVTDWYLEDADSVIQRISKSALALGAPPTNNTLFNGTNVNPTGPGGKYSIVSLTPTKTHRLRLINPSTENNIYVSLVGHNMTVIANDLVPVKPLVVDKLLMGVGQRYDVLITADQAPGNYWFNVTFPLTPIAGVPTRLMLCGAPYKNTKPAAIFHYEGAPDGMPTVLGPIHAPEAIPCNDLLTYEPIVQRNVPQAALTSIQTNDLSLTFDGNKAIPMVHWNISGAGLANVGIQVDWGHPTLQYVRENNTATMPANENVLQLPNPGWTVWLIENKFVLPVSSSTQFQAFLTETAPNASSRPRFYHPWCQRICHLRPRIRHRQTPHSQPRPQRHHHAPRHGMAGCRFPGRQSRRLALPLPYRVACEPGFECPVLGAAELHPERDGSECHHAELRELEGVPWAADV